MERKSNLEKVIEERLNYRRVSGSNNEELQRHESSFFDSDTNQMIRYWGFDMGATNNTDNNDIHNHNKMILDKFKDYFDPIVLHFIKRELSSWKGSIFIGEDYHEYELHFGGWTTEEIIHFLIVNQYKIAEKIVPAYKRNLTENIGEVKAVSRIITRDQRYKVLKRQRWKCNLCHETLKFSQNSDWNGKTSHIDHIHPFSKKDSYPNGEENINEDSNLQALCSECNLKKGDKNVC